MICVSNKPGFSLQPQCHQIILIQHQCDVCSSYSKRVYCICVCIGRASSDRCIINAVEALVMNAVI